MSHSTPMPARNFILLTLAIGIGLTVVFWSELWLGGGLIGGDLYSYFLPQKSFYAEQLAEGRIPFWNDRVGFGYPILGESQTGALYPPNLLLFSQLDLNTAYNVSQLLHYASTFAAAVWCLRSFSVSRASACFGAFVYTYSWFPPRICLEWAIIGGPYLPLGLAAIERFLTTNQHRYCAVLTSALGLHLLAGHYNLAFIECVVWTAYAVARVAVERRASAQSAATTISSEQLQHSHLRSAILVAGSLIAGFALTSFQLIETYDLKQQSQREGETAVFDPATGHIPPAYLLQTVASWWYFHSPAIDTDAAVKRLPATVDADTNQVEAHLYFGLLPLALATWQLVRTVRSTADSDRQRDLILTAIAVAATIYATGVLVPLFKHLPGFGYFIGPGRWGIVPTLVVSLFAAKALDTLPATINKPVAYAPALAAAALLTCVDLGYTSQCVTYARVVPTAPIDFIDQSPVKGFFERERSDFGAPRVYGPGANVLTLLGVSQWPTYLGLGPAAYWEAMPKAPGGANDPIYSDEQRSWLAHNTISHVLTFEAIDSSRWNLEPAAMVADPVLNAIWGRRPDELVHIYRVPDAKPPIRFEPTEDGTITVLRAERGQLFFEADASRPFDAGKVVVEPLWNHGWSEDGRNRFTADGPLRLVDANVNATSAGENVGAYILEYVPAGARGSGLAIAIAATTAGLFWLAWLYLTRPLAPVRNSDIETSPPVSPGSTP